MLKRQPAAWAFILTLAIIATAAWLYWRHPPVVVQALFLGDQGPHRPSELFAELQPVLRKAGIGLTYTESVSDLHAENLQAYDALIIYANHESIGEAEEKALLEFVEQGGGFVPIHCASFCFRNSPSYIRLVGAQFKSHETGVFRASIADPTHPLMADLEEFETWDETYRHEKTNPDRQVLMVREESGLQEPWTWVRTQGKGRIFYTAYGHDRRSWSHPGFQRLLERGILWAAGQLDPEPPALPLSPLEYREAVIPFYPVDQPGKSGNPVVKMQLPLEADESIRHLRVPAGFEVRLFAAEPEIVKPAAMAWDEKGRLWIAETLDYPNDWKSEAGQDRIKICEDTDQDGRADKFTIFADQLSIPTSLVFAAGGLIVSQPPDILFFRDTDGDDRADERRVLFSGFGVWDTHAGPSNLRYGFDNWIWGTVGYAGFKGEVGGKTHEFRQGIFRFRPDGSELEFLASTSNNTWGLGFSEEGFVFASTANNQHSLFMGMPNRFYEAVYGWSPGVLGGIADHSRFHPLRDNVRQVDWHGGFTAAAGHALYTARTFPRSYWNRVALVAEPTGSLLHKCVLRPQGSHFVSHDGRNLLASTDEWTAPIAAEVGPDGAVWVIDWYNIIVQHNPTPQGFQTGAGNAYETPLRDKKHGRIYRILPGGAAAGSPPDLRTADSKRLIETLQDDNLLWRLTAQRLLVEGRNRDVLPGLLELVRDTRTDALGLAPGPLHALWTLDGLGALEDSPSGSPALEAALEALQHPAAAVRRAACLLLPPNDLARGRLLQSALLADPEPQVRLAALLTLADSPADPAAGKAVFELLKSNTDLEDRWIPDAVTAAGSRHSEGFLAALAEDPDLAAGPALRRAGRVLHLVAGHYARQAPLSSVLALLSRLPRLDPQLAGPVLEGLAAGWPREVRPRFTEADRAELTRLMQELPGSLRDRLLLLADRWGGRNLFSADVLAVLAGLQRDLQAESVPLERRLEAATRLIHLQDTEPTLKLLLDQMKPGAPTPLIDGLMRALARSSSPRLPTLLIARWDSLTPAWRPHVLSVMLRRSDWTTALLNAMEKGRLDPAELTADQLQQLTHHLDSSIAARTSRLAAAAGRTLSADRQAVLDRLLPAAERRGNRERGRIVFEENCRRCHTFNDEGGRIGPALTGIGERSRAEILTDILDPNRSVEGNYRLWIVTTRTGEVLTGKLDAETQTTIELLETGEVRHVIPRQEIARIRASRLSIMPEGFEEYITAEDLSSLLDYLTETEQP